MRYNIFSLQSGTALEKCQNPLEDGVKIILIRCIKD